MRERALEKHGRENLNTWGRNKQEKD